mmetsp:Transcript_7433/g.18011  ORF Transcript_7433/g.18011 Transcript_7433/m.18011 type:complete len:265 (-) Transcript_7433:638-1432(-)
MLCTGAAERPFCSRLRISLWRKGETTSSARSNVNTISITSISNTASACRSRSFFFCLSVARRNTRLKSRGSVGIILFSGCMVRIEFLSVRTMTCTSRPSRMMRACSRLVTPSSSASTNLIASRLHARRSSFFVFMIFLSSCVWPSSSSSSPTSTFQEKGFCGEAPFFSYSATGKLMRLAQYWCREASKKTAWLPTQGPCVASVRVKSSCSRVSGSTKVSSPRLPGCATVLKKLIISLMILMFASCLGCSRRKFCMGRKCPSQSC